MEIDVPHVRKFHGFGEGTRFVLVFQGVESVRVSVFAAWPGPVPGDAGTSHAGYARWMKEYPAKGREESLGWGDFVAAFPTNTLDIYSAEIAPGENTASTVRLVGTLQGDDDRYVTVFLRAEGVLIRQTGDGGDLTLEQFIELGKSYWKAWSAPWSPLRLRRPRITP